MTSAEEVVESIEAAGGVLALHGESIHCRIPEGAAGMLNDLRAHKEEVLVALRRREELPTMPTGVRLLRWEPKSAPVVLAHYAVVTNVRPFVLMTLLELKAALAGKRWQSGHREPRELVDRLEQCGVYVEIIC